MRITTSLLLSAALVAIAPLAAQSPASQDAATTAVPASASPRKARFGDWGVDLAARDSAVKPGNDFWAYANGGWDKRTEIAPDRTSAGVAVLLVDEAERQVRAIVEDLARDPGAAGSTGKQVGDFYAAWMDEAGIEARGLAPLWPYLAKVDAVASRADLLKLWAEPGYVTPVALEILPDPADTSRYVAGAGQDGLGLPNRDYYLNAGAKFDAIRKAYRDYVVRIQTLAGLPDAEARADRIIALETALAKVQWTPERSRDIKQIYNPMDRAKMTALAPQFDWPTWLAQAGLADIPTVVVFQPSTIEATGKLLDSVPLATWKEYSAYHFVRTHAQFLPKALDDATFAFFGKTLRDQPEQRARWKRGVQLLNQSMGEAIGQLYVDRHYPPESDRQMRELIANLRIGLEERIKANTWMDAATKKAALVKLAAFDPRIGHPVKYVDYSPITVDRADPLGNAVRAEGFAWDLQLSRLGKPVDRDLWEMNPQEVNAYYNPLMNQITFPAAILQPPFFDPASDPAVNYGSIGAVIGHEIGHGFDDQGRQFDATGKIRDWWTPASATRFTQRTKALGGQYSKYEALPGTFIKGDLTMGENIGDLGGIEMAYAAYRRYVAAHGTPPVLNGLTGDQRFFLAYAQSWQTKRRDGALREQLLTDPHSPSKFRVNGVVRNVDAWYKAFNVKPGDKLYLPPAQRVRIW